MIDYLPLEGLRSAKRKVRKIDPVHVREVAATMAALGFCVPVLIGNNNVVIDGEVGIEAAKLLGVDRAPCVRIDHLSDEEQRLLRLAVNRLGEKGQWNLDELKIEFEELILTDAPIEISGFGLDEIDQIVLGEDPAAVEQGPLAPKPGPVAIARLGNVFQLGPHRLVCGDATDPAVYRSLFDGDAPARLVLTDEPYNVKIKGNVTGGAHCEFAMASGEMSDAEFLAFNVELDRGRDRAARRGRGLRHLHRLAGIAGRRRRRRQARPDGPEPHRLGQDQRRHGQPLSLPA